MYTKIQERINKLPERNFIEFLNVLGFHLSTSIPAKVPVTFKLVETVKENVFIPKHTRLSSDPTPNRPDEIVFETEEDLIVTPALESAILSILPQQDSIFIHKDSGLYLDNGIRAFDLPNNENIQEHILYIANEILLNLSGNFEIHLNIRAKNEFHQNDLLNLLTDNTKINWEYNFKFDNNGKEIPDTALKFDVKKRKINGVINIVLSNQSKDIKKIEKSKINGIENYWIRCRSIDNDPYSIFNSDVTKIESITLDISFSSNPKFSLPPKSIIPDILLYNDITLFHSKESESWPKELYPFGKRPLTLDSFYIGCNDAFSKKESKILIKFKYLNPNFEGTLKMRFWLGPWLISQKNELDQNRVPLVSWQYWNGTNWTLLSAEMIPLGSKFYNSPVYEWYPSAVFYKLKFDCPSDIEPTEVNGNSNFWIRALITSGNYGIGKGIQTEINDTTQTTWDYTDIRAPKIEYFTGLIPLSITSKYDDNVRKDNNLLKPVIVTYNNLMYNIHTDESNNIVDSFQPFKGFTDTTNPVLYIGFNKKIEGGPIMLYWSIHERRFYDDIQYTFDFYYYSIEGWKKFIVIDETRYLLKSGYMKFILPSDFTNSILFGRDLCWIKIVDTVNFFDVDKNNNNTKAYITKYNKENLYPYIQGVDLNTVSCIQANLITDEILNRETNTEFSFLKKPVTYTDETNKEQIWVKENDLEPKGITHFHTSIADDTKKIKQIRDVAGNTLEVWILWDEKPDLLTSTSKDRHYFIDRTVGKLIVGDGKRGKTVPIGTNNVKANYMTGGGSMGNVMKEEIKTLKSQIPFIDSVINNYDAEGGSENQTSQSAMREWPSMIKNRSQAVTSEDFETLIRNRFMSVEKVKCFSTTNDKGNVEPGHILICIVPKAGTNQNIKKYKPTISFLNGIKKYISEITTPVLVSTKNIHIQGPLYLKVSVSANVFTDSISSLYLLKKEASACIDNFLNPLTGGAIGKGWNFNQMISFSDIHLILSKIEGIKNVKDLNIKIEPDSVPEMLLFYDKESILRTSRDFPIILKEGESINISDIITLPKQSLIYSGDHQIHVDII